jgi:peptidoglycan/xylan/chitin deacetylase (PgdA/CDA1 family)
VLKNILIIFLLFFKLLDYSHGKEIALSFDDNPRPNSYIYSGIQRTKYLINNLELSRVPQVVFFSKAGYINNNTRRKRMSMYANAGHLIANHTYSHWDLNKVDARKYVADIDKAEKVLLEYKTFIKWFRFPFLHEGNTREKRDFVRAHLKNSGYINGYVTVDNYDWSIDKILNDGIHDGKKFKKENLKKLYIELLFKCITFYDNLAIKYLKRSPKHVLLLHENDIAALFIIDLVDYLRQMKWDIISPQKAYTDPIATHIPDVLLNNQGRIMAIAKERGYKGPYSSGTESINYIKNLFKSYRVWIN